MYFSLQGVDIVKKALKIPCFTIASNAGVDAQEIVTRVMQTQEGYDARVGQFVDMMKAGIIDPTKVCVTAVQLTILSRSGAFYYRSFYRLCAQL